MEHDIPFGNSNRKNGTTFLDFPLFLGIFQWDEPTKRVPFTAEPEIPEILTKWKAPLGVFYVSNSQLNIFLQQICSFNFTFDFFFGHKVKNFCFEFRPFPIALVKS